MHELQTERLILRPFREKDFDDLCEFLSQFRDDEFGPHPGFSRENGRQYLERRMASDEFLAMEHKGSGKVVGNIYYGKRDFEARELGFIVNKDYQRRGYGRKALSAVAAQAFREGVHRVYAECDPRNTASWRLLEAAGLRREAHFRRNIYFFKDETGAPVWKDSYVYALTEEDVKGNG